MKKKSQIEFKICHKHEVGADCGGVSYQGSKCPICELKK